MYLRISSVVGDTLFNNGIGRTDLYRGDYETLVDSIKDKLFELEGDLPLFWPWSLYNSR